MHRFAEATNVNPRPAIWLDIGTRYKALASFRTSNNFATSCCKKGGNSAATFITNASKVPNTTKQPGRSALARFCNYCIRSARPKYNPHLLALPGKWRWIAIACEAFRGYKMSESRSLTILCVSSYEKGQEFLRTCKAIGCRGAFPCVSSWKSASRRGLAPRVYRRSIFHARRTSNPGVN